MGALLSYFRQRFRLNSRDLEVLSQLGEGGFSIVYHVRDIVTHETFALKVISLAISERKAVRTTRGS